MLILIFLNLSLSTLMFIAALFTVAQTWKQLKCSVTEEWIKKKYIYTIFSLYSILCILWVCPVMSDSLQPRGLQSARLLCPWHFPDKNTRMGYYFLPLVIFLIQGSIPHLLRLLNQQVDSLPLHHMVSPSRILLSHNIE